MEYQRLSDAEESALLELMTVTPTTLVGATNLLNYVADIESRGQTQKFKDGESGRSGHPSYFIQRNVADVLTTLA